MTSAPDDTSLPIKMLDRQESDRPREKALRQGIRALSNVELLAIVLGEGLRGIPVIDMSRDILHRSDNSLLTLSKSGIAEMKRKFKGVGDAKAVLIAAVFELSRRWRDEVDAATGQQPTKITSSADIYRLVRSSMEHLPHEEFRTVMLSRANNVITQTCISRGGTTATVVDPKLIFRSAIDTLAAGIILVHNHPSGNLTPSPQDDALTRRIADGAKLLDIRLLDHLIISPDGYYSYADNHRLP